MQEDSWVDGIPTKKGPSASVAAVASKRSDKRRRNTVDDDYEEASDEDQGPEVDTKSSFNLILVKTESVH